MMRASVLAALMFCAHASAAVFLNEIFINPPGSLDDTKEYIELQGTPGMKLDGYAVAVINGGQIKLHPASHMPPDPGVNSWFYSALYPDIWPISQYTPEIDEFFSLDGLQIGPNGLLVVGIGAASQYPLLADAAFRRWTTLWNGGLDTTGKLANDGSTTVMLIRRRPGRTQANAGSVPMSELRWGKDIEHDSEMVVPANPFICVGGTNNGQACDPLNPDCPGGTCVEVRQFGDGSIDKGLPKNYAALEPDTLDLKGENTPDDLFPDLEVVDEVSFEGDRGFEYDVDDRKVDDYGDGPASRKYPRRRVHSLGDPRGFNPDCLTRVDYRTKGPGWAPRDGGTGQLPNGNNWQDTATEQWIRGESIVASNQYFYSNVANSHPDAIQPYETQVPEWLVGPSGYEFTFRFYPIQAGYVNLLAVPFIPGDVDRDGVCDQADIAKLAAVFGDDDWIFSNSYLNAPYSDRGDPAAQTRPWDVDATGDNGIEASDLQWVLNFQGNTNGRIVGIRYDSTTPTPPGSGVVLNPGLTAANNTVGCTVSTDVQVLSGRTLSSLKVGDRVEVIIRAEVSAGAIALAGQENGAMQFVHDIELSSAGVLRVQHVEPLPPFQTTRSAIQIPQGQSGDLGMRTVNGYTTSFVQGLAGASGLYKVVLQAKSVGSATLTVSPAVEPKFLASTPRGLKIGHSNNQGNPASAVYPAGQPIAVTSTVLFDVDGDGDVDEDDLAEFYACATGPALGPPTAGCEIWDRDGDQDIDSADFGRVQKCITGSDQVPDQDCDLP